MTCADVAAYLQVSMATVRRYVRSGMPVDRMGDSGRPRFRKSEIDAWLKSDR